MIKIPAILFNENLTIKQIKCIEREAGFYTTRYGRSDPMMRIHEAQTRYYPEPIPLGPKVLRKKELFSWKTTSHKGQIEV